MAIERLPMDANELVGRLTCTVPEAGEVLGIGRDAAYAAAGRGEIPTLRLGHRLVVPVPRLLQMLGFQTDKASDAQDLRELAEATDLLLDAAAASDLRDRSRDAQGAPSPTDPYRSSSEHADEAGGTR